MTTTTQPQLPFIITTQKITRHLKHTIYIKLAKSTEHLTAGPCPVELQNA